MNKFILGFAACALTFASCSQNEVLNNESETNVIGFTNLNDRLTKVASESGGNYAVYATRSDASTVWFMNNVNVNGSTNAYSPLRYWPTGGATVNFYAFAPISLDGSAVNVNVNSSEIGELPLTYTVPSAANEDFTIATPVENATSAVTPVNLQFSHMLSKITVSADLKQELKDAGYTVSFTSASLTVAKNTGTTDLTTKAALTAGGSITTYVNAKSYIFIPQSSVGTTIQVKGVIIQHNGVNYWTGDMKAYLITTDAVSGNLFAPNTHYVASFTINSDSKDGNGDPVFGNAIEFSSSIAADWTSAAVSIVQP